MFKEHRLQYVTTVLAYALPVAQFLFGLLNTDQKAIFLFSKYMIVVTALAGIIAYIMLLLLKSWRFFQYIPFQKKLKAEWRRWDQRTNRTVNNYTKAQVDRFLQQNDIPSPLFTISTENIVPRVLLPIVGVSAIIFLALGAFTDHYRNVHQSVIATLGAFQAVDYIVMVCATVAIFALIYYRSKGQRDYERGQATTFERALELARRNNAFGEQHATHIVAQKEMNSNPLKPVAVFLMRVGEKFYILATNMAITKIELCISYTDEAEALNAYNGLGA